MCLDYLAGIRPTPGPYKLHAGHLAGFLLAAKSTEAHILIADLHAPACSHADIQLLSFELRDIIGHKWHTKVQSEHSYDDGGLLGHFTRMLAIVKPAELERLIQYRLSTAADRTAHLLTYPVLQACDMLGYKHVLVGPDQRQHVDYARDWIERYNKTYSAKYPLPRAVVSTAEPVYDLLRPEVKMSKSNPAGCLFLFEPAEEQLRKLRKAVTTPKGRLNLIRLLHLFAGNTAAVPEQNFDLKLAVHAALRRYLLDLPHGAGRAGA